MNKKNYIKKISNYAVVGGLGAILLTSLTGCEDKNNGQDNQQAGAFTNASQKQGAFVIVEKTPNGGYIIVNEYPSRDTRIVLRDLDGSERILSQSEIDILVKQEEVKIDNGTSNLTNPQQATISSGGMGLGEVLLSSIAGAMIGSYIGNKLFNNQNFNSQKSRSYKSPSAYSRSVNSFNKAKAASTARKSTATKKSGFFGTRTARNTRSRSFFGG
ncbi:MAG: UPF0323 family lipoprotein [Arcobacteraceae bacterium]|nr:UPF0323 family lipoprotein [Arcobacteraceae bacterium]